MRRYVDRRGHAWDVVVGRESWGTYHALFVPASGNRETGVRQALLAATSHAVAAAEIEGMDDAAMHELFERSQPRGDT